MSELIVDGYNVAHAWPELAPLMHEGRLEDARRRLVAMLAEYAAAAGERVTVVFDSAHRRGGHGVAETLDGVDIVFASSGHSADTVIERRVTLAARRGEGRSVTVASDDRLHRDLVVGMGGAVIGAAALREQVVGAYADVRQQSARRTTQARLGGRLGDRLDPELRRRLDRLGRAEAADDV